MVTLNWNSIFIYLELAISVYLCIHVKLIDDLNSIDSVNKIEQTNKQTKEWIKYKINFISFGNMRQRIFACGYRKEIDLQKQ